METHLGKVFVGRGGQHPGMVMMMMVIVPMTIYMKTMLTLIMTIKVMKIMIKAVMNSMIKIFDNSETFLKSYFWREKNESITTLS